MLPVGRKYFPLLLLIVSALRVTAKSHQLIACFPEQWTVLNDVRSIAQLGTGFVAQVGRSSVPIVRTLRNDGALFTAWELPFERSYYSTETELPAGTACGDELCLLLNGRLDFFLPDGEFIRCAELNPPFSQSDLATVAGMAYDCSAGTIHFITENPRITWSEYSTNGSRINFTDMSSSVDAGGSFFLASIPDYVLLGHSTTGGVALYYHDGTPVAETARLKSDEPITPSDLQLAVSACVKTLGNLYGTSPPGIVDMAVAVTSLWVQTTDYLIHFGYDGQVLDIPCARPSYRNPAPTHVAYTAEFPCGKIIWSAFSDRFMTIEPAGKLPRVRFWNDILPNPMPVVDVSIDTETNWWMLCETSVTSCTADAAACVVKRDSSGEFIDVLPIQDDDAPYSFVRGQSGPVAVAGRYNIHPLEVANTNFWAGYSTKPWPHGLSLAVQVDAAEVASGAADARGHLYLCVRKSSNGLPWKSQRNHASIFNRAGTLIRKEEVAAGYLMPDGKGQVFALDADGDVEWFTDYGSGYLQTLASADLADKPFVCGFILRHSGILVTPDASHRVSFYAPAAPASCVIPDTSIQTKSSLTMQVRPRGKPVVATYNEQTRELAIYGPPWKNKLRSGNTVRTLARLGKKLKKKPAKVYRRLTRLREKNKSKIKKVIISGAQPGGPLIHVGVHLGVKRIRLEGPCVASVDAEWGDRSLSLGKLDLAGDCAATVTCAQIKKLIVKRTFSGELRTWLGDVNCVWVGDKCVNARIHSRRHIRKVQVKGEMVSTTFRAGISPVGYAGYDGNIKSIRMDSDCEDCQFIACADEGNTPGWSGIPGADGERYRGSIVSIASRVVRRGSRRIPVCTAKSSLFVTRELIRKLSMQLEDSRYIANGHEQQ